MEEEEKDGAKWAGGVQMLLVAAGMGSGLGGFGARLRAVATASETQDALPREVA